MATPSPAKKSAHPKNTVSQAAKQQSMLAESARSTDSRKRNKNAATADMRIKGHALGVNKSNTGKRAAKQGGK